jgi:predicted aldo/keto reductase-like oxidoreductase
MLATKLPSWQVKTAEDVENLFNEQLASCGVDYFDVYHMHALDKDRWATMKAVKAYDILMKKKAEGKIRHLGFSYHGDFETFCEIVDTHAWDFVQIQINYLDYTMTNAKQYHDKLNEKGVACIVMEPVRGGFLAGLIDSAAAPLRAVNGDSDAEWALRWCMDQENMPIILSGMSNMEQLEQNLATFSKFSPMTDAEKAAVEKASEAIQSVKTVPCTACNYCMPCPFGVKIPESFRVYNQYKQFGSAMRAKKGFAEIGAEHTPDVCTKCGVCIEKCPQGIQIPDRLEEANSTIAAL